MIPNSQFIKISDNLNLIRQFIDNIIIRPRRALMHWARVTNQTPAAKIGYIGQHLASLVTGVPGTGSGARGDDLADGSEVKSCNKVDQADKCRDCGARVLRIETQCPGCGSTNINRKDDSKWLFSVRDENELQQYLNLDRIVLIIMDYPQFATNCFDHIRLRVFELYPREPRMAVFGQLITNHYRNIFLPKLTANRHTNPMNLHPDSFQFYKCNPIKTFECWITDIDTNPAIRFDEAGYISPYTVRDESLAPVPMPSSLLKANEWAEMLSKADFSNEILPLVDPEALLRLNITSLTEARLHAMSSIELTSTLPYLDERLRSYISMRPVNSTIHRNLYHR